MTQKSAHQFYLQFYLIFNLFPCHKTSANGEERPDKKMFKKIHLFVSKIAVPFEPIKQCPLKIYFVTEDLKINRLSIIKK